MLLQAQKTERPQFAHVNHMPKLHPMWDVPKPQAASEEYQLEPAIVDMFDSIRGYGFVECGEGRLFFHASGFRLPLPVSARLTLAQAVKPDSAGKVGRIPIPVVTPGMELLIKSGRRNRTARHQVLYWCLQGVYRQTLSELEQGQREEIDSWHRLGRYRLELCERPARDRTKITRTKLFLGTHVEFLKGLFVACLDRIGTPATNNHTHDRWFELAHQVKDSSGNFSDWEVVDASTMIDFMNS